MLKRIILFAFILSTLVLIALAPMNITSASEENTAKLQATVVVPPELVLPTPASGPAPVVVVTTGGMPTSTMIIVGLLVLLGFAVVIGGAALMSRRGRE